MAQARKRRARTPAREPLWPRLRLEARGALTLAGTGLLVLMIAGFADGTVPQIDAVRSLWPQLSAVAIAIAACLAVLKGWRRAAGLLGGALIVLAFPLKAITWDAAPLVPGAPTLRVLTINALVTNLRADDLAAHLVAGPYDLVAVQEAPALLDALGRLDAAYPHRTGCEVAETCDLMLLSRRPLVGVRWRPYSTRPQRLVTARVDVGGHEVGIAATHLTKPHHDGTQRYEGYLLLRALRELPTDAVLMGDFNAAPWTGLMGWLRDASGFAHARGYRPTAPVRLGPLGVPIDHVMTRGGLAIGRIAVLPDALGSNHYGVAADLVLR